MPGTRRGIYIEFIGDEIKYVRSAENVLATNTKLDRSFKGVSVNAKLSAEAQVAAAVKAQNALRAQAINLRAVAAASTGEKQATATRLAVQAEAQLAAQLGVTTRAHKELSSAEAKGERDLNKIARGALAGSGLFAAFGRALAFASTGFIAFAAGATVIRSSFDAATELLATQRAVDRQLKTQSASWAQYGKQINATDLELSHVSGFTNQQLLQSFEYLDRVTGNVSVALKLNATAADVARGRNIALSSAALALGKAYGGSITALRRLGIVIPQNVKGMAALEYVARKFAGQAQANATVAEKFNATLVDSKEIIGTALLPTINQYLTSLGEWLQRMNESGRLQKDVEHAVADFKDVLNEVIGVVKDVDKVTGSFKNTLKLIAAIRIASIVTTWMTSLGRLAASWTAVATQANLAADAEARALGLGGGGLVPGGGGGGPRVPEPGGGGGGLPFIIGGSGAGAAAARNRLSKAGQRVDDYLKASKDTESAAGKAASTAEKSVGTWGKVEADVARFGAAGARIGGFLEGLSIGGASIFGSSRDVVGRTYIGQDGWEYVTMGNAPPKRVRFVGVPGPGVTTGAQRAFPRTGTNVPGALTPGNVGSPFVTSPTFVTTATPAAAVTNPFAGLKQYTQFVKSFQLSFTLMLQQAEAGLTKSTADDVAVAKKIIATIQKLRGEGRLHGAALIAAINDQAQAQAVLDQAAADAAQKAADAAQKASDAIEAQIDPAKLELRLAKATALGQNIVPALKALRAAAQGVIDSGKGSLAQQTEAYNRVTDLNQQIKDALANQGKQYEESLKLRVALAREEAFGLPTGGTLAKLKAAAVKAAKSGKYTGQNLIDIYNLIAGYNDQINTSAAAALGLFKQAKLSKLTGGLGLTRAQRKALEGRLSQLGPKGTVPGTGTGAAGYAINPRTDRPIAIHNTISLDGRVVARNTTIHQQRSRRRNPPQRRGPNAGAKVA